MTEIQTLLLETIKAMRAEQESMKGQISSLETRLTELEQTQNILLTTQEELGKTQNVLLQAQEEVSSLCKDLELGLTKQLADVEGLLKELEGLVSS